MTEASVPSAALPAWWKCTSSTDHRFSAGAAYEVQEYNRRSGCAVIVTDIPRTRATLPVDGATFVPHDPWERLHAAQAIEARRAETGTGSVVDESAVGNADAPKGSSDHAN